MREDQTNPSFIHTLFFSCRPPVTQRPIAKVKKYIAILPTVQEDINQMLPYLNNPSHVRPVVVISFNENYLTMRKALAEARSICSPFSVPKLNSLKKRGFKFVQIRGITVDYHYDYTEPSRLVLVPIRELPIRADEKDIYESLESELLLEWARHPDEGATVVVAPV